MVTQQRGRVWVLGIIRRGRKNGPKRRPGKGREPQRETCEQGELWPGDAWPQRDMWPELPPVPAAPTAPPPAPNGGV